MRLPILLSLCFLNIARAEVTVYSQVPIGATATGTGAQAIYTAAAAYDPLVLQAPEVPSDQTTNFQIQLQSSSSNVENLSIQQSGHFFGFSVEMSVVTQVIGLNGSYLFPVFLNLMANVQQRAGSVRVRVGGNTQDYAYFMDSLPDGASIEKDKAQSTNPTDTPTLILTPEFLYTLANVTSLTNVQWYLGIPFNDSSNFRLQIAEYGQSILGDNLLGLQVANEPDLYADHGHRQAGYSPYDYYGEFGNLVSAIASDDSIPTKNNLIGPNIATGDWQPQDVWNTGFVTTYSSSLGALAVEHYPTDNCAAMYGYGTPTDPQTEFPDFLNHTSGQNIVNPYLASTALAQQNGKPFIMFETNTASCGGFPGISDSFGATLWAIDYGLQMAYANFSNAMLHVGGQNDYYNPFTPPPTNMSTFKQWTVGSVYYSVLAVAETFGKSGKAQIVDMGANSGSIYTPAYAIYEDGAPVRVALFNYITDSSGASAITANIQIEGAAVPSSVRVKYMLAPSVSEQSNITWAGQTFGGKMSSDGRLQGEETVQTVTCDTSNNQCAVTVPAPGFALVFLTDDAYSESEPSTTQTFSTTAYTKTVNTATVDPSVLATSNGHSGSDRSLGSTSKGSSGATSLGTHIPGAAALISMALGAMFIGGRLVR